MRGLTRAFGRAGRAGWLALALALAALAAAMPAPAAAASAAEELRFVAFGDAPYTARQRFELTDLLAPAIRESGAAFLVHVGDFKDSGESCTDALIAARFGQLMDLLPDRVFYTPGDNDWTDCDRPGLRQRFAELERLDHLRGLIRARPVSLPADWRHATQAAAGYPENARWAQGGAVFATLHIVGTNNGRRYIDMDDAEAALERVARREAANLAWLGAAFDAARETNAQAVVLAVQADVTGSAWRRPCGGDLRVDCDAHAAFREALANRAAAFGGPVLLVHGDTAAYCLDRGFGGDAAPRLWRLNLPGDDKLDVRDLDAAIVTLRPGDPEIPFAAETLLGGVAAAPCS